jgi:hypothetical protein
MKIIKIQRTSKGQRSRRKEKYDYTYVKKTYTT